MFYSVLVETSEGTGKNKRINSMTLIDRTKDEIKSEVVMPYLKEEDFLIDGYCLNKSEISRIKIVSSEQSIENLVEFKNKQRHNENLISGIWILSSYDNSDIINSRDLVRDITNEILKEVRQELKNFKSSMQERESSFVDNKRVFIVHGHNEKIKLDVSNFLRKLELEPVILHEQANQGKTIIEKIEDNTDVGYGIILYTPCDKGGTINSDYEDMNPRARQNVIFEHGYLIGKLGRNRVCALVEGDVEKPSDINGVLYIQYEKGWEPQVGKELRSVGYDVDLNKL